MIDVKILYPNGTVRDTFGMPKNLVAYDQALFLLAEGYEVMVDAPTCQRLLAGYLQRGWKVKEK